MAWRYDESNMAWFTSPHDVDEIRRVCEERKIQVKSVYSKCCYIEGNQMKCLLCQQKIKVGKDMSHIPHTNIRKHFISGKKHNGTTREQLLQWQMIEDKKRMVMNSLDRYFNPSCDEKLLCQFASVIKVIIDCRPLSSLNETLGSIIEQSITKKKSVTVNMAKEKVIPLLFQSMMEMIKNDVRLHIQDRHSLIISTDNVKISSRGFNVFTVTITDDRNNLGSVAFALVDTKGLSQSGAGLKQIRDESLEKLNLTETTKIIQLCDNIPSNKKSCDLSPFVTFIGCTPHTAQLFIKSMKKLS